MTQIRVARLGDHTRFASGGTPSRGVSAYFDGDIPWITGADIGADGSTSPRAFVTGEAIRRSAAHVVPVGTVLLVTRTSVGKVGVASVPLAFSQDVTALTPDSSRIDTAYLVQYLKSRQEVLAAQARGATIKGITREVVAGLEIPLPPLEEQRRIAAILDQADALCAKRREAIALLDTLGQSIFFDMFGDAEKEPAPWPLVSLDEVLTDSKIGLVRAATELGKQHPFRYVRMGEIGDNGRLDLANSSATYASDRELLEYALSPGDLLLNTRNSKTLVGKTAVFRDNDVTLYNNNIMRMRFDERVKPDFVDVFLRTDQGRRAIDQRKSGTTSVFAVYAKDLRSLQIPLPPVGLQAEFAGRIAAVLRAEALLERQLGRLDALFLSLQDQAFKGEL